jgi:hypothetical protein
MVSNSGATDVAIPAAGQPPGQPGLGGQQHDFHDVRGAVGHRDHIAAEDLVADLVLQLRHAPEYRERFARLVVEGGIVHLDRVDMADPGGQPLLALGFGRCRIIEIGIDLLQYGGDRAGVHGRLLADVELQQMEAEALDQADQGLQVLHGDDAVAVADQRVAQQVEVVEECGGVFVGQVRVKLGTSARHWWT